MQLSKRFLLITLPLLLSTALHTMDNNVNKPDTIIEINEDLDASFTHDEFTQPDSTCCPWRTSNNNEEKELFINNDEDDNNNSKNTYGMTCKLLQSLLCRSKEKALPINDVENGLVLENNADQDEDNNTSGCSSFDCNKLKIASANAAEIAFKLGLSGGVNYLYGPENEVTFFTQHHAAEAIGRHIKFNNWRVPKYVIASVGFIGLGLGLKALEPYLFEDYETGVLAISWLTVFKLINHYFNQLNHAEHHNQHHDEHHDELHQN